MIMLTARDKAEDRLLGKQTVIVYCMAKPFFMDNLLAKIKQFLLELHGV